MNNSNIIFPESTEKKVLKKTNRKTRNRIPLSCSVCRNRKVKCDKNRPHCNSCVKTGYKHLCHYLSPEWSKEGYTQLSHEKELTDLREKVKRLEEQLSNYQRNSGHILNIKLEDQNESLVSPHSLSSAESYRNDSSITKCENQNPFKKFDNDVISIGKRFESLHINPRNNTLSYLGSTHYLSILKGDPYLKILWSHVFKIREKLLEYQEYQRTYSLRQRSKKMKSVSLPLYENIEETKGGCPVSHQPNPNKGKCPVSHESQANDFNTIPKNQSAKPKGKCPVAHPVDKANETTKILNNIPSSLSSSSLNNQQRKGRCPVDHKPAFKERSVSPFSSESLLPNTSKTSREELIAKLNDALPQPSVIKKFINLFFRELYPEIPILDETLFKKEIKRILQINDFNEKKDKYDISIHNTFDSSHLGILLVIIRLGCVNISQDMNIDLKLGFSREFIKEHLEFNLPTDENCNVSPDKAINSKPIDYSGNTSKLTLDPTLIHQVHDILIDFNLSGNTNSINNNSGSIINSNLALIHFLIFYKWYLGICPENDTINTLTNVNSSDNKSELLLAQIIQLSFDSGLHRDPDNYANLTSHLLNKISENYDFSDTSKLKEPKIIAKEIQQAIQRFKNQWRKTWFFIVDMDINQCLNNGTPRLLRKLGSFTDVKLPYSEQLSSEDESKGVNNPTATSSVNNNSGGNFNENTCLNNKQSFMSTVESLVYTQQFDYCFDNNLGEIIIGKNCKLFYQLDLVLIAVSELVLISKVEDKCKKWKLDLVIDTLIQIVENKSNENIIEISLKKLLDNCLLDPLESYALVQNGIDIITPEMCKTQSQKERFAKYNGYNLPSLKNIFEINTSSSNSNSFSTSSKDSGKKLDIPQESITKCLFFKKHLQLEMMLYTLNYILFTSYEPKLQNNTEGELLMDLTTNYCQKTLKYSTELFKTSLIFFHNLNSNKIFKTQMKIVIIPYCLDVCYRAMQFMICLILRHKVGPLLKDLNNIFSKQISGSSSNSDSESDSDNMKFKLSKVEFNEMLFKNEELTLKESYITDLLISRMEIFHNLTRILAVKYNYSLKLSRSTGFFLALLKPGARSNINNNNRNMSNLSTNSNGSFAFSNKLSNCPVSGSNSMGSISKIFKNIPSLIIQANGDQLSRCPVYQDTIGFQNRLPSLTNLQLTVNSFGTKPPALPSLQYQPITSKISSNISDIRTFEEKSKQLTGQTTATPLIGNSAEPPSIQRNNLLESNILPLPQQPKTMENELDSISSEDYIPDFEEFLKQVQLTPTTNVDQLPQPLQAQVNTPDGMDMVDLNMLISPNSIMQASLNFLMPLESFNEDGSANGIINPKREDSNQSVWDLNEELIN